LAVEELGASKKKLFAEYMMVEWWRVRSFKKKILCRVYDGGVVESPEPRNRYRWHLWEMKKLFFIKQVGLGFFPSLFFKSFVL